MCQMIQLHFELLNQHYLIEFIEDPHENPLYHATEICVNELENCVDKVTNCNELPKLLVTSKYPFVKLTRRGNILTMTSTPIRNIKNSNRKPVIDLSEKYSNDCTESLSTSTPSGNDMKDNSNRVIRRSSKKRGSIYDDDDNHVSDNDNITSTNSKMRRASPDSVMDLTNTSSPPSFNYRGSRSRR